MRLLHLILFLSLCFLLTTSVITRPEADSALQQIDEIGVTDDPKLLDKKAILCNNLALFYQSIDDNQQAVLFLRKALKHSEKRIRLEGNWSPQDYRDLQDLYLNLAKVQSAAGYIDDAQHSFLAAETYFKKLRSILPDVDYQETAVNFYSTAFAWAFHAGLPERAETFGQLQLDAATKTGIPKWISDANRNLGELFHRYGDEQRALEFFESAVKGARKDDASAPLPHMLTASVTGLFYKQKRYDDVIEFMKNESMYSSRDRLQQDIQEISPTEHSLVINNIFILSYAYIRGYQQNSDPQYLEEAQAWQNTAYQMAEAAMFENGVDRLGQIISSPEIKITSTLKNYELLEQAEALSQDEIAQLLRTIDVYHATQLHVNRLKNEINGENWNKQKNLQRELSDIFERIRTLSNNSPQWDSLQNRSFQVSTELAHLAASTKRSEISKEYKLGQKDFANRLQKYATTNKKTVVTYFWSKQLSRLYIIGRNPKRYFFKTVEVDASFPQIIGTSYDLNANFLTRPDDLKKQDSLNQALYTTLIAPIEKSITTNNLLVYPIGIMSYVSMDALRPNASEYLIEKTNTSYTSSLFSLLRRKKTTAQRKEVVAFYPTKYGTDSLAELYYAKDEITLLDSLLDVSKYEGKRATKRQFLKKGTPSNIIHIASHSILDPQDPFNSYLIFEETDSIQSYHLRASEIFRSDFDANLVVLSSCNSAKGTSGGEIGIISLSNAFYFSGVPTTLGSLWSAQDNSSSKIIQSFYRNLSQKQPVSKSLSNAKRTYLSRADAIKGQPFFWANYVMYGSDEPVLFEEESNWNYYMLFAVLLLVIIPLKYYKRSRRSLARS